MEQEILKYKKDITWSLPILFGYEPCWAALYHVLKDYEIDMPQINGFGSPSIAWTGGRVPTFFGEYRAQDLLKLYNYLNDINCTPALTFTYTQITKDDLKDRYANYFLDIALEAKAHFIIYSDLLKNYIKEKDPDAYVVASVIKPAFEFQGKDAKQKLTVENETNLYNNLLKEYDLVVVRPEYSKSTLIEHPEYIDDISRIEVLINQPCIQNCPRMPEHYRHLESGRLGKENIQKGFKCIKTETSTMQTAPISIVHSEEQVKKLLELGVEHLKVQGRGVRNTFEAQALLLYNQMCKQTGKGYLLFENLIHGALKNELAYYGKLMNLQPA